MHKLSAQIASIHQESVDYALVVLRETTRQLFLLDRQGAAGRLCASRDNRLRSAVRHQCSSAKV
jgi:hypothetical protein